MMKSSFHRWLVRPVISFFDEFFSRFTLFRLLAHCQCDACLGTSTIVSVGEIDAVSVRYWLHANLHILSMR